MMDKTSIMADLRAFFESDEEIAFAYLFGSLATGVPHSQSDIDVAVFLAGDDRARHLEKDEALLAGLSRALKTSRFDLVVLNYAPVVMAFGAISGGEIIFSRDEQKRIDFEISVRCRYFDLKPFLDEKRRILLERMSKAG